MKKTLLATSLLLAGAAAHAGLVQPAIVEVDLDNRFAAGDTASARFADDDVSFIGCGTRHLLNPGSPDGVFDFGFCQGADADGDQFTCFSDDPGLVARMSNGDAIGFITFSWDEDGNCTRVGFSKQSFYLPEFTEGDGAFPGQGNGPGNNSGNGNGNNGNP